MNTSRIPGSSGYLHRCLGCPRRVIQSGNNPFRRSQYVTSSTSSLIVSRSTPSSRDNRLTIRRYANAAMISTTNKSKMVSGHCNASNTASTQSLFAASVASRSGNSGRSPCPCCSSCSGGSPPNSDCNNSMIFATIQPIAVNGQYNNHKIASTVQPQTTQSAFNPAYPYRPPKNPAISPVPRNAASATSMIRVHLPATCESDGNRATAIPPKVAMKYGISSCANPSSVDAISSMINPIASNTKPRLNIRFK